MVESHSDGPQFDPDTPSLHRLYLYYLFTLAVVSLLLEGALFFSLPPNIWSIGQSALALTRSPYVAAANSGTSVLPGHSVVWQGAVWAASGRMNAFPPVRRFNSRQSGSPWQTLTRIHPKTGEPIELHGVSITSPVGLVVVDEKLYAVSESAVNCIEVNEADGSFAKIVERFPKRALNHPTKPFVYEGKLAVIDKNANDVYTLLTWNDTEWDDVSRVEAPVSSAGNAWFTPELRVLFDGKNHHMFFWDLGQIHYREGIVLLHGLAPVSALHPENYTFPASLDDLPTRSPRQWTANQANFAFLQRGWTVLPVSANWDQSWEVAAINGQAYLFVLDANGRAVLQFKHEGGRWVKSSLPIPPGTMSNLSVAGDSSGYYFVNDDQKLLGTNGASKLEHITTGPPLTDSLRYGYFLWAIFSRYFLAMGVLAFGAWWLMRRYRSREYTYGKRSAVQASILRRGIARCIDIVITVFPPSFWLFVAFETASFEAQPAGVRGIETPLLFATFSIFGMWIMGILILSYTQGRWGVTPGKWLCGIRTFRTTMRPCGMLRATARELMVYADSLMLITWLPGVLSIALTKNRQRLGDLTADTIVVVNPNERSWLR